MLPNMPFLIDALLTGTIDPDFAPGRGDSAIAKRAVTGSRRVSLLGIEGDAQADLTAHGGRDKAIHHYPGDHYAGWASALGPTPLLGAPGAFGENISTTGMTEEAVCLGDRYRMGSALVEVAQGRQPCWKQAHYLGVPKLVALMVVSGRTGWYYRVIEEGAVAAGDALVLEDRPCPQWPVARLFALLIGGKHHGEAAALAELGEHVLLAEEWRRRARGLGGAATKGPASGGGA